MRNRYQFPKNLSILLAAIFLMYSPLDVSAANYKMAGILSAVNLSDRVVVIEVKRKRGWFTVAGPVATNARLSISSRLARLDEFKVGKQIDVEWHSTTVGHVIDRLLQ